MKVDFLQSIKDTLVKYRATHDIVTVGIMMHDNPDPDCIGSACGMKRLLESWVPDIQCSLVYNGEISHTQNKTLVNVLKLRLTTLNTGEAQEQSDHKTFDFYITVDGTPERCGVPSGVECLLTVDHHKCDTKRSKHKDIRQVGSCCSIVWDYLIDQDVKLDKDNDDDVILATAMLVGIKTDTSDLVTDNVSDLDFDAYKYLIGYVSQRYLSAIINYPIPPYYFELRKRLDAEGNVKTGNGIFIGGIGYLSPAKRDVLPTISEERARIEGIDTAFIFAIVGDNIEVSVRSSGLSIDVNSLCQKIFGKQYAGGKTGAGAARIPMGFLSIEDEPEDIQEKMWVSVRDFVIKKIMTEMAEHR